MLRAASVLFGSDATLAIANMVRTVLVARLLSLESFGIATTFNILMNAMTMASGFGLGQMLIQSPDGEDPRLQAGLHSLQAGMGVALCAVFVGVSGVYAELMNIPGASWAYAMLAIVPLLIGLVHFDIYRQQRDHNFGSISLFNSAPVVISLLMIWPLYLVFGDWRLMPFALLTQAIVAVMISHLRSQRSYRLSIDQKIIRRGLSFGAPLFGNAILLFLIFSGDRMIVSNQYGLEDLAWFSAAFMLTLMPVNILVRTLQSLLLPRLSKQADNTERLPELVLATCEAFALTGAAVAVFFALVGEGLLLAVFGPKYVAAAQILTFLGAMQALRCARAAPNILAMSGGRTRIILYTTLIRASFIPLAAFVVYSFGLLLPWLIVIGTLGELAAMLFAFGMLRRTMTFALRPLIISLSGVLLTIACVIINAFVTTPVNPARWLPVDLWALVPLTLLLLAVLPMRSLQHEIFGQLRPAA